MTSHPQKELAERAAVDVAEFVEGKCLEAAEEFTKQSPQTATERFLRHGVAGGWKPRFEPYEFGLRGLYQSNLVDETEEQQYGECLLDPSLWEAAGRSLGWTGGTKYERHHENGATLLDTVPWMNRWHGLLDHLAANPGDVEGYLSGLISDIKN